MVSKKCVHPIRRWMTCCNGSKSTVTQLLVSINLANWFARFFKKLQNFFFIYSLSTCLSCNINGDCLRLRCSTVLLLFVEKGRAIWKKTKGKKIEHSIETFWEQQFVEKWYCSDSKFIKMFKVNAMKRKSCESPLRKTFIQFFLCYVLNLLFQ